MKLFERREHAFDRLSAHATLLAGGHGTMLLFSWVLLRFSWGLEMCEPVYDNCDPVSSLSLLGTLTGAPLLIGLYAKRLVASGLIALIQAGSPILSSTVLQSPEVIFDFSALSITFSWLLLSPLAVAVVAVDRRTPFRPTLL